MYHLFRMPQYLTLASCVHLGSDICTLWYCSLILKHHNAEKQMKLLLVLYHTMKINSLPPHDSTEAEFLS